MLKLKHEERYNTNYIRKEINRSTNEAIAIKDLGEIIKTLRLDETRRKIGLTVKSPLENSIHSTQRCLQHCPVKIERSSINYVLLEDEPHIRCSNLVVAYKNSIKDESNNRRVYLGQTCLFPKIRGVVSLCLLIFAPIVELRVNKFRQCYTGALCGLGVDKLGKPLWMENDSEDVFEVNINDSDIRRINHIRDIINTTLSNDSNMLKADPKILRKFQKDNRKSILSLLQSCSSEVRKIAEPISTDKPYIWDRVRLHFD